MSVSWSIARNSHKKMDISRILTAPHRLVAEALAATRQAIIIVSAAGAMLLCTEPAEGCLKRYFEGATPHELPETLRSWTLQHSLVPIGQGNPPESHPPFIVDRETGRLTIRLINSQTMDHRLLMFDEQNTGSHAAQFRHQLRLTVREAEVLFWVSQGKMNADIATLLGLKTATVEKHLEHIFAKLNVETRTAAARCAHESLNGPPFCQTVSAVTGSLARISTVKSAVGR